MLTTLMFTNIISEIALLTIIFIILGLCCCCIYAALTGYDSDLLQDKQQQKEILIPLFKNISYLSLLLAIVITLFNLPDMYIRAKKKCVILEWSEKGMIKDTMNDLFNKDTKK